MGSPCIPPLFDAAAGLHVAIASKAGGDGQKPGASQLEIEVTHHAGRYSGFRYAAPE
jgi:hypothetical protein